MLFRVLPCLMARLGVASLMFVMNTMELVAQTEPVDAHIEISTARLVAEGPLPHHDVYFVLTSKAKDLIDKYSSTTDEAERAKIVKDLTAVFDEEFERRQILRATQLAEMQLRLKRLWAIQERREKEKDEIVKDHVRQVLRGADGLGWGTELDQIAPPVAMPGGPGEGIRTVRPTVIRSVPAGPGQALPPGLPSTKGIDFVPSDSKSKSPAKDAQPTIMLYENNLWLTPLVQAETEDVLTPQVKYLESLGFELQRGQITLRNQENMNNAHYYHSTRSIIMDPRVISDQSIMRREYNHYALAIVLGAFADEIAKQECAGVESALADYLGCSQVNDPEVGIIFNEALGFTTNQRYLRTMQNDRKFNETPDDSGRHAVGETLSGALWEMRTTMGKEKLDPMLYKAWIGIVKINSTNGQVKRFAMSLLNVAQKQNPTDAKTIQAIFEKRGLKTTEPLR